MRLRRHRQNVVVWGRSTDSCGGHGGPWLTRPGRTGAIRRCIRTGGLLVVIGLVRLVGMVRPRWRFVLAGGVLTVAGVILRGNPSGIIMVPGVVFLLSAPLIEAPPSEDRLRRCQLARELAEYSTPAQRWDLEATLDQYPDAITHELRDILAGQHAATGNNQIPGAGRH